jgi:hypothetical protein
MVCENHIHCFFNSSFLSLSSSSIGSPRITECRIHAVRLSLDELFVNAWNQCTEYYPYVGYIFGGLDPSSPEHKAELLVGWRSWCIFSIPPLRLLSISGTLEWKIAQNGLSGRPFFRILKGITKLWCMCQGIIMFLQSLPTQDWGDHEIEMLLSEAFVLNSIWHNAQSHFNGKWNKHLHVYFTFFIEGKRVHEQPNDEYQFLMHGLSDLDQFGSIQAECS